MNEIKTRIDYIREIEIIKKNIENIVVENKYNAENLIKEQLDKLKDINNDYQSFYKEGIEELDSLKNYCKSILRLTEKDMLVELCDEHLKIGLRLIRSTIVDLTEDITIKQSRHNLKICRKYFQEVLNRKKTAEIRINDRDFKVGDILILKEWDKEKQEYTGIFCTRKISHILTHEEFSGLAENYVMLSFEL